MDAMWRHFFTKADDPNLMTASELGIEANYALADMRARKRLTIPTVFNPLIEFSDAVAFQAYGSDEAVNMLVDSQNLSVTAGQTTGTMVIVAEVALHSGGI
jgi:hypothetical protein